MTKKDYIKLAKAIREDSEYSDRGYGVIARTVFLEDLCLILKEDNPNFDTERFLEACK